MNKTLERTTLKQRLRISLAVSLVALSAPGTSWARKMSGPRSITVVSGRVVRVSDGDTVVVLEENAAGQKSEVKVRLDGIDAPEKSQPFGEYCRKKLADRVAGKSVQVKVRKEDRYGRSLGRIQIQNESVGLTDASLLQLEAGCAWFYRHYSKEHTPEDRRAFEKAESRARSSKVGLWSESSPTPPWDYRKFKGQKNNKKKRRSKTRDPRQIDSAE